MGLRVTHSVSWLMALTIGVLMHVCVCSPAVAAARSVVGAEHKCCRHAVPVEKSERVPGGPCRHCLVKAGTVAEKPAGPAVMPGLSVLAIAHVVEPRVETGAGNPWGNWGAASVPIWLSPPDLVHSFCQLTV